MLGGFARTIQKRRRLRIGWPTPLLGLIVLMDVSSFWLVGWALRDAIPIQYFPMMCGLVICGLYYLVSSLHNQISIMVFLASALTLALSRSKRADIALLAFMALQYPVGAWLQMMGW